MTSLGIWSLEGTPGILEVYNQVDSPPEDQGDDSNHKRAEVASKLLETLENFNYDETAAEPSDAYISDWLSGTEATVQLPSIFEDLASIPPPPPLVSSTGPGGGFYSSRACAVQRASPSWNSAAINKKAGYEASPVWAGADEYPSSLYSPPLGGAWPLGSQVYQSVPNQLTPPHSPPSMYAPSPKRPLEFQDLADDLLKPTTNLPSNSNNTKEENTNGQLIMSLFAEMNQKDIDDIVQCSVEQNFDLDTFGGGPSVNIGQSPEHSCSSSDSNFGYHSESDRSSSCGSDPDYNPYSPPADSDRKATKSCETSRSGTRKESKAKTSVSGARTVKPYARKAPVPIEDKRLRKKEQNKNAATRYRIKKKAEVEVILGEESELQEKNDELKKSVEDLNREIKFMKKFMRDFFKTQGVLK